ncbi:hypothetical protein ACOMHN_056458 [Nucella lapillus]
MCAAVQQGTDLVGVDPKTSWIQFAADNVDHQIRTLDGTGPFHGMGIIGAATPGTKECRAVRRDTSVTPERIDALGRVPVHFYNPSSVDLSLVYEILQDFAETPLILSATSASMKRCRHVKPLSRSRAYPLQLQQPSTTAYMSTSKFRNGLTLRLT